MAIALVGSVGAVTVGATTSVQPTFGQATTAGNLLVCVVTAVSPNSTSPFVACSDGTWTFVGGNVDPGASHAVSIWMKANCGAGETAPTWSKGFSNPITAQLTEWSGAGTSPTADVVTDTTNGAWSAASPKTISLTLSAVDSGASDLYVAGACLDDGGKSATVTVGTPTWSPTGGTSFSNHNGTTKTTFHAWFGQYIVAGNGGSTAGSVSVTFTASTGTISGDSCLVSIKAGAAGPTAPSAPTGVAASQAAVGGPVTVTWTDETTSSPAAADAILRSTDNATFHQIAATIAHGTQTYSDNGHVSYTDTSNLGTIAVGTQLSQQSLAGSIDWPGGTLDSISLWLAKVASPTDNITVSIQTDASGLPSGTSLRSVTIAASSLSTSLTEILLALNMASISAQKIWVVVSRSGALDATNFVNVGVDTASANPDAAGGTWVSNATPGWSNIGYDLLYDVASDLTTQTYWYKVMAYNASGTATSTSASTSVHGPPPKIPVVRSQAIMRASNW